MGHGEFVVNLCLSVKVRLQNLHREGCLVLRGEWRGREVGYECLNQVAMMRRGLIRGIELVIEVLPVGVRVPVGLRVPAMVAVLRMVATLFPDLVELQIAGRVLLLVVPQVAVELSAHLVAPFVAPFDQLAVALEH